MEYKDYYAILGVPRNADNGTIKRAFRGLARQLHPDINPGNQEAEQRFKEVNEAYAVLGNDEKRQVYDRLGGEWRGGRGGGFDWSTYFDAQEEPTREPSRGYTTTGQPRPGDSDLPGSDSAFSDFFQQMFNMGGPQPRGPRVRVYESSGPAQNRDAPLPIEISLEEAFQGALRTVQQGGARFDVSIPRGVKNGDRMRVAAPGGEMVLEVRIKPHAHLAVEEAHLRTVVTVGLYTALLGGEVRVHTLEGALALAIPPDTQNGRTFRLRGQGMPTGANGENRGDLLVDVVVELPVPLGEEERRLFARLRQISPPPGRRP